MSWWKIGMHLTSTGNMNGIGDYIQTLRDNNRPVALQSVDSAGVIFEALQKGSHPQDALVFRRATGDDPNTNTKIDRLPEMDETYIGDPVQIATSKWDLLMSIWPPELDPSKIWTVTINEPSKEPQNYDYLSKFALTQGLLAIEQGRKVLSSGWSGGTPDRGYWESPYMLQYLKLCESYPDNVGISLHEYSFDENSLETGYPYLIGRFQELHDVCDKHGIARPTIIIGEFGAGEAGWHGNIDYKMSQIQWAQDLYENHDNILGAGCWTLGEWGGSIVEDVLSLIEPITNVAKNYPYSPPEDKPIVPPIEPPVNPPETIQLFKIDFTGWGVKDNQEPLGWYDSTDCDNVQVPYGIFSDERLPMNYEKFEGENPFGDGESWNKFSCPENVTLWGDMLPSDEQRYLNSEGRTQHWFCPATAGRSRFTIPTYLKAGTYRLTLDAYGDFAQIVNGKKVPQNDPKHGQIELFISEQGKDTFINIALIGDNHIYRDFTVEEAGTYDVGYGLLSRWSAGGGTAGFFLKGFEILLVSEPELPIEPPSDKPKIVIVKKPQIDKMTFEENQEVSGWAWDNYGRTATHSTDDMITMLRGGNEESYAVVWWKDRQSDVIEKLEEEGFEYITIPEEPEPTPSRPVMKYRPSDTQRITQGFMANPQNYQMWNPPGHEGVDLGVGVGLPFYCTQDGIVVHASNKKWSSNTESAYGYHVVVDHRVFRTVYAHAKSNLPVRVGQTVKAGDIVGYSGNTGNSTGYHLHYSILTDAPSQYAKTSYGYFIDPTYVVSLETPSKPIPPPSGDKLDLLPYIRGNGVLYEVQNANGGNERFQTQIKSDTEFWQTKNSLAEQLFVDSNTIYRGWDVSPGNGRYYVQQQNGQQFAKWLPRYMSVGETVQTSLYVQFYNWDCQKDALNSGNVIDTRKFVAYHNTWASRAGITLSDVIELSWENGGERYFYAKGYGLVAWERSHQDPNTPSWSAISEIHGEGQRPDNVVILPNCL